MSSEDWKRAAAKVAAKLVKDDMAVGLGSGTTVYELVRALAEIKPKAKYVASSSATQQLADRLGLELSSLGELPELDLALDGADEVAPDFTMIKGGGGAHTREKIVAGAAKRVVIIVDQGKLVKNIGETWPVPTEVLPFAHQNTASRLKKLGGDPKLRLVSEGQPYITDNGNYILDVKFKTIEKPEELEKKINQIPGVIENGIFCNVADQVIVGHSGGVEILKSPEDFSKFLKD